MKHFIFIFLCFFTIELTALIDLDEMEQSFILETKRIHVPGYPDAFNPSIVRFQGHLLMSFRSRDPVTNIANLVGFVWLDKEFNPMGTPQLLELETGQLTDAYIQDPRLIIVNNQLYMPYSDLVEDPILKIKKRKMCVAQINYDGVRFLATAIDCFHHFQEDKGKDSKFEKNWVPFDYQDIMLLAYTISPHKIFLPIKGEEKCVTIAQSSEFSTWQWGVLRGGTPALLIGNHYLSFFHSSTNLATVQSNEKIMPHYVMGAYIFENQPPFAIKKISPHPIVSKDFYNGESHQTWKPLQVIFPCGYIYDDKYIWVSYGRQDYEAWIVKLDKAGLFKSLVPFASNF